LNPHGLALAAAALLALSLAGCSPEQQSARDQEPAAENRGPELEIIRGVLDDGTQWALARPALWNRTLVLDLDGANFVARRPRPDAAVPPDDDPRPTIPSYFSGLNAWLLERGYAYGGITREPVGYD